MSTQSTQLAKRLYTMKKYPELYRELPNDVLAEHLNHIRLYTERMELAYQNALKSTVDKDKTLASIQKEFEATKRQLEREMSVKLNSLRQPKDGANGRDGRDGKDAQITEKQIRQAAEIAYSLIELPNFDTLIEERITANPFAVRDALEMITDEEEKVEQSAIRNLPEDLKQLQEQIARVYGVVNGSGTIGKQQVYSFINQAIADGTISSGGGGSTTVEIPTGTVNASNDTFTVANEPLWVISDGIQYFEGVGYSYSSGTITMDIPPSSYIRSIY